MTLTGVPDMCRYYKKITEEYKPLQRETRGCKRNIKLQWVDWINLIFWWRCIAHSFVLGNDDEMLNLLELRADIAETLILSKPQMTDKRLPSSAPSPTQSHLSPTALVKSRAISKVRPIRVVQFDQIGYFPDFDNRLQKLWMQTKESTQLCEV